MTQELPEPVRFIRRPWRRNRVWSGLSRSIAALTAFALLFSQLVIPAAAAEQNNLPRWLTEEEGGWVSPEQAGRMQRADQDLLAHLSALEQAQQRFVLSHPSGLQTQYAGGELVVARDAQGNLLWAPTLDDYQKLKNGTLLLADGTLQVVRDGRLTRQVDPFGNETFFGADGQAEYEIAVDGTRTTYQRTVTPLGTQVARTTGGITDRFSFDPQGRLYAAASDRVAASADPFAITPQSFTPGSGIATGVVATDGTYLYVKPAGGTGKVFQKIGTGFNGTVVGRKYDTLTGAVKGSISATVAGDGLLYQPDPTNLNRVERINPTTGQKVFVPLATPLLPSQSSPAGRWSVLITSDGRYVYNLSSHQNRSSTTYNGWTIRVYDPQNGWAMVREFTAGTTSFAPAGFWSDGVFLYLLEKKTGGSAKVVTVRIADAAVVRSSSTPAGRKLLTGQYDGRNQRLWVGTSTGGKIYAQDNPNDLPRANWEEPADPRSPGIWNETRWPIPSNPPQSSPPRTAPALAANEAPIGYLDSADPYLLSGWAVDPNDPAGPQKVRVLLNGQVRGEPILADLPRPDLVAAGIAPNAEHGYHIATTTLNLAPGTYTISIEAQDSQTQQWTPLTYTKTLVIAPAQPPIGYLDSADETTLSGWAVDPDNASASARVQVVVDGNVRGEPVSANQPRSDLVAAGIAPNPEHGYRIDTARLGLTPGTHTLSVQAQDSQTGQWFLLTHSKTVVIPGNRSPIGYLDFAGLDRISGWSVDPDDRAAAQQVEILVDGAVKTVVTANQSRGDLVAAGIAPNPEHGYSIAPADLGLAPGAHTVTARSIDTQTGQRKDLAGTHTLIIPANQLPIGYLDFADLDRISGWSVDPDNRSSAQQIEILVDGVVKTTVTANQPRSDLVAAGIAPNAEHGYSISTADLNLSIGSHTVTVQSIDAQTGQRTVLTGSKTFVIIDRAPPLAALESLLLVNQRTYTLTYRVTDNIDSARVVTETVSLIEGANRLTRTVTDAAGNATTVAWTVTLDTIAPTVSLVLNEGIQVTQQLAIQTAVTGADVHPLVAMRFSTDGQHWTESEPFASSKSWSFTGSPGEKTLFVQVQDAAGNWSSPFQTSIQYDPTWLREEEAITVGDKILTFIFNPFPGEPANLFSEFVRWTQAQIDRLRQALKAIVPAVAQIYGSPLFDRLTIPVYQDPNGVGGAYTIETSSANSSNLKVKSALTLGTRSGLEATWATLAHELAHAFRHLWTISVPSVFFEEGMAEAVEVLVFKLIPEWLPPIGGRSDDDRQDHRSQGSMFYEAFRKPGLLGGYGSLLGTSLIFKRDYADMLWSKIWLEDRDFFRKFNQAYGAQILSDPSIGQDQARLLELVKSIKSTVESEETGLWFQKQAALIPAESELASSLGERLYTRQDGSYAIVDVVGFTRESGANRSLVPGTTIYQESLPDRLVTLRLTDAQGRPLYEEQARSGPLGVVSFVDQTGFSKETFLGDETQRVLHVNPNGYTGRATITASMNTLDGQPVKDVSYRPYLEGLPIPIYDYVTGTQTSLFGVTTTVNAGQITITNLTNPAQSWIADLVNGMFYIPDFPRTTGSFRVTYQNTTTGETLSRVITKDEASYYIQLDTSLLSDGKKPAVLNVPIIVPSSGADQVSVHLQADVPLRKATLFYRRQGGDVPTHWEVTPPVNSASDFSVSLTGLNSETTYELWINGEDRYGWAVTTPITLFTTPDVTTPVLNLPQAALPSLTNARTLSLSWGASEPVTLNWTLARPDGTSRTGTISSNPISFTEENLSLEGSYTLTIVAEDNANNRTTETRTFTIDRTAPAVVLTSATLTQQPAYTLTYTVDGVAKTETRTLAEGPNPVNKTITDAAGNSIVVSWIVTLETPLTPPTLASPAQTTAEQYQAVITTGGQPLSTETWRLGRGTHQLIASASNSAGKTARARLAVTRTGSLPEPTNPPEEPQGNRLTQTLADGSVAAYVEGQLVLVTTTDGTQLKGPMLDTEGKITGGWIVTPDGTTTYLENGAAVWSKEAGGSVTWYFSDGRVEAVRNADGSLTSYGYRLNAAGQIDAILVTAGDLSTLLDPDGKLTQQLRQDGRWLSYQNGRLVRIEPAGAAPFLYTETVQPNGSILSVRPELVEGLTVDLPRRFLYAADGSLSEVTQADGTVVRFESSIPVEITAPDGTTSLLSAQESNGILSSLTVTRNGITRNYDSQGQMASLRLTDGSNLTIDSDQLKGVGLPDGAQVIDGVYDADNRLVSGRVLLPDGRTVTYAAGQPTEAKLPDGTKITYDSNGTPTRLQLSTDLAYTVSRYTVTPLPIIVEEPPADDPQPYWVATLASPDSSLPAPDSLTQILYSDTWVLQQANRADGAQLAYRDGRLNTLTQSNGTVISYAYDAAGKLTSTVAASPDPAELAIRTEYAYDKIRRVLKGTVPEGGLSPNWDLVYDYSYEFEQGLSPQGTVPNSSEITVIREPAAELTKRYRAGLLISQTDPDGAVTAYEYASDPAGYQDPFDTAVGAVRSLSDGTIAHYSRSPAGAWTLSKLTLADGTELLPEELNPSNLLGDFASLETWSSHSPFDAPDGWKFGFDTGSSIAWETSPENVRSGSSSVKLTTGPGGGDSFIYRDIVPMYSPELDDYEGKTVTLGAWVKTSQPGAYLGVLDGVIAGTSRSENHPGDGQWHFLTVTRVNGTGGIGKLVVLLITNGPNATAYFDDAVFVMGPAILTRDFSGLLAEAALPDDPVALRRMIDQGALTPIQPDALDRQFQTAVGAVQTLADGTQAHYTRTTDPVQPWKLDKLIRQDGSETTGSGMRADPLSDPRGVTSAAGKIGNAAQFDSAQKSYLTTTDSADLSMGDINFTLSGWVYLDTQTSEVTIGKGDNNRNGFSEYTLYLTSNASGQKLFRFVVGNESTWGAVNSSLTNITTGRWYHLIAWHDAANDILNLQVDDNPVDSASYTGGSYDSPYEFAIGRHPNVDSGYWNGRIDEVGLWKRLLTAEERAALYNNGNGSSGLSLTDQLMAYFSMDESSGERADSSYNATLAGLFAEAALPTGRTALRRMVEQGALSLRGSEATEAISPEGTVPAQGLSPAQPAAVLTRATVSYQGKERETFTYRYEYGSPGTVPEGGLSPVLTYVTDSAGVTRGYDSTKRLISIEQPDGTQYDVTYGRDLSDEQRQALESTRLRTFQYTELDGSVKTIEIADPNVQPFGEQNGEEITLQHLTRRVLQDGTKLKYAFGQVQEIHLPDGRLLTDFTVDRNGIPLRATLKLPDGTQRAIQNGSLVELTREDGVQLRYRDDALVEVGVPVNAVDKVTISAVGVDAEGHLKSGEILLPSGDRLLLQGGRFTSARLSDGTEMRSVTVEQDMLTGAVLSVNGSNALLSDTRNVEVTLPSGQKYLYRYKLGADGQPTNELETMTFRDDFEDGNALGWSVHSGSWSVSGGDFRADDTEYAHIYASTGLNWADYTVTTQFNYESFLGPAKEAHLAFRWQDPNSYYMVRVLDRSFQGRGWVLEFGGKVGGQWFEQTVAGLGGFNSGGTHTLSVKAQGSSFSVYLDGQTMGSVSDGRISRGSVGLGANHSIVRFHDLEVTFPGEDLRDDATYQVDSRLRDLRQVVSEAVGPLNSLGFLPPHFDPELANSIQLLVLEESNDPDVKAVVAAVRQATSDPTLPVVTEMDTQGRLISAQRIDGSVVTYNAFQKPTAQYDIDGRLQTEYRYDGQGRLIQLSMRAAREGFNERQEVLEREVARRKTEALQELARQKNRLDLEMEANITVARESLANIATTIQEQLRTFQTMEAKGKEAKKQKSQAVGQIQQGLKEVLDKQKEVEEQYAQALGQLHGEVETQRTQIDTETNKAFAELNIQKENFFKEILRQEIRPVVDWVYRDVLGRDPSLETELKPLVEQAYEQQKDLPSNQVPPPIDVETLAQMLRSLPEHADRSTEVQAIKQQVGQQLNDYIRAPPQERQALLDSLGLTASEVVDLTQQDADQVLQWLLSQGNHFGHSAFLALKEYLAGQGIQAGAVELAVQTILIDVLVGVLNPKTTGDLELSLFSLQRVAKLHLPADGSVAGGGAFSAQVDFADLQSLLSSGPVIAHVNGNHYMVILSIAADGTITYREPNQGPAGETFTMTEAELGRIWKGAILTPRAPPHAYQLLTDHEAQQIRGSFFLAAIIFLIIKFREQIAEFLQSVAVWINDYLPTFISPIKSVLSSYFAGWANILQGNFKEGLIQLGTVALTVAMAIINPVAFAISITVSTALNALGVNPTISSLVSAFISGGVTGGLSAAANLAANAAFTFGAAVGEGIVSGLISAASNGAQLGLVHLGVDPALASLAGIGVHTLTSSFTQGIDIQGTTSTGAPFTWHATGFEALSHVFSTQLVPTLAGELGIYGITKLGESIGLDPRISQLAGMTIGNGFRAIATPANSAKTTMDSMWEGLKKGALQVGLQFATPGLDPLLGGMASSIITGAIDGLISPQDPNKPLDPKRKGIFAGIADTFHEAIKGFEDIGVIKTNDPVGNAQRLAQLTDFTQIVQGPGGLAAAIETYGTGFLYRSSVESLINAGTALDKDHAIQAAINAQLQDPNTPLVELEGRPALQINLGGGNHLWVDPNSHALLATLQGQDYIRYVAPPKVDTATHTAAATNAEITRTLEDGSKFTQKLQDGKTTEVEITGIDGTKVKITPNASDEIRLNADGSINNGVLTDSQTGVKLYFKDNELAQSLEPANPLEMSAERKASLAGRYDLSTEQLNGLIAELADAARTSEGRYDWGRIFDNIDPRVAWDLFHPSAVFIGTLRQQAVSEAEKATQTTQPQQQPTLWQRAVTFYKTISDKAQNALDTIATRYLGQSEPTKQEKAKQLFRQANLSFFNGDNRPDYPTLTRDERSIPSLRSATLPWAEITWRPEEEVVIVSYGDKIVAMGMAFFNAMRGTESTGWGQDQISDHLGNRFSDPQAAKKVGALISTFGGLAQAYQALRSDAGVYHVKIERYGTWLRQGGDQYRWSLFAERLVEDPVLKITKPERTYIQDKDFSERLIQKWLDTQ